MCVCVCRPTQQIYISPGGEHPPGQVTLEGETYTTTTHTLLLIVVEKSFLPVYTKSHSVCGRVSPGRASLERERDRERRRERQRERDRVRERERDRERGEERAVRK